MAWADKALHGVTRYPYVYDMTLPQHRLSEGKIPLPRQDDYPIWYFLNGGISRPEKLAYLWKLDAQPYGRPATVQGLKYSLYRQCVGLIRASVNDEHCHANTIEGFAYLVRDKLAEDRLRYFKTNTFEMVRCKIRLLPITKYGVSHVVNGLTSIFSHEEPEVATTRRFRTAQAWGAMSSGEGDMMAVDDHQGAEYEPCPDEDSAEPECDYAGLTLGNRGLDFPFIKNGRERAPLDTMKRRSAILSSSRPRSKLMSMTRVSDPPSPLASAIKTSRAEDSQCRQGGDK